MRLSPSLSRRVVPATFLACLAACGLLLLAPALTAQGQSRTLPVGILKSDGNKILGATAGTEYVAPLGRTFFVKNYGAVAYATQAAAASGTDSTSAIIAADTAAYSAGGGSVYFDPGFYKVAGALVTTAGGNAQIPLPVQSSSGAKISIAWYCPEPAAAETYPLAAGSTSSAGAILLSTLTGQTYSSAHGLPSVVGSPTPEGAGNPAGQTLTTAAFSNIYFETHGVAVRNQGNPTLTAWDLGGVLACNVQDARADTTDVGPSLATQPSNPWAFGLIMPRADNNVLNRAGNFTCVGYYAGYSFSEHNVADNLQLLWCSVALAPSGIGNGHAAALHSVSVEQCPIGIGFVYANYGLEYSAAARAHGLGAGPPSNYTIDHFDVENVVSGAWTSPLYHVWDPTSNHTGSIHYSFSSSVVPVLRYGGDNLVFVNRRTQERSSLAIGTVDGTVPTASAVTTGSITVPGTCSALIPFSFNGTTYYVAGFASTPATVGNSTFTSADSANTVPAADTGGFTAIQTVGTWGVKGNQLYCSADGTFANQCLFEYDYGRADATVSAAFTLAGTTARFGLVGRLKDSSNYLFVDALSSGSIFLTSNVGGTQTNLAQVSGQTLTPGQTYTLSMTMTGTLVTVSLGGVQKLSYHVATGLENNTKHGIYNNFFAETPNGGTTADNLNVTSSP